MISAVDHVDSDFSYLKQVRVLHLPGKVEHTLRRRFICVDADIAQIHKCGFVTQRNVR